GLVWSSYVMFWLAAVGLRQAWVAAQLRVALYAFEQEPGVVTSAKVSVAVPQTSLAVGVLNTGVAGHSIVAAAPTPERVGLLWSSSEERRVGVLGLPQGSVAV